MKQNICVLILSIGFSVFMLSGCEIISDGESPTNASYVCDAKTANGFCQEFSAPADDVAGLQVTCALVSGTDAQACPTADFVGKCTASNGTTTTVTRYYSPNFNALSAGTVCTNDGGTFTTTP